MSSCQEPNRLSNPAQQIALSKKEPRPIVRVPRDTSLRLTYTSGIRSILEDSKGNFWFGSHSEGVCLYDGEKLRYFTVADGLTHNQIRAIYEDTQGTIWFEGGIGISSYQAGKITQRTAQNYYMKQLWASGPHDLWFKGNEMNGYNALEEVPGVYRYDGNSLTYHAFPLGSQGIESPNTYYSVSTPFVRGHDGTIWLATYGAVWGFDGASFTILDDERLGLNDATGHLHVRSLFEDSKGNLWIGNNGMGVLRYDGQSTISFSQQQGLLSANSQLRGGYRSPPGSLEHVFAIGEDREGNMWFGDRDTGAWRYDGQSMQNYTEKDGLTTSHIWQIVETANGELWFAMGDGSVCLFKGESFERIF